MVAWGFWGRRNKKAYEDQLSSPKAAIEQSMALLAGFSNCLKATKLKLFSAGRWQPLEERTFKLNIDGAVFADLQVTGMGAIVLDSKGEMILAAS